MIDIQHYGKRLEQALAHIEKAPIPKANKESLLAFYRACVADGIKAGKLHRYLGDLLFLTRNNKKKYIDYTRKDIEEIVVRIEQSAYAEWTKYSYKIGLRKFFTWLKGKDGEFPPEVKWIKLRQKACNAKMPEDLVTEEEVKKMILAVNNLRDRALIASLYESGCCISEILTMCMKHVIFDMHGVVINVFGKTGSRRVRLVSSTLYLQEWINRHPLHDNPEAYVWCKEFEPADIVGYDRIRDMLKEVARRAGVKKKVNPHNFRHSRANLMANHLTESQLKEVFGWTQASRMASVYVHLSGKNTDTAVLRMYGKVIEEEVKGGVLLPMDCMRCKTQNEATNKFCRLCGLPLDEQTQHDLITNEYRQKEAGKIMDLLLKDKEVMALLQKKMLEKVQQPT